jgi:HAD superfamily hydrolase (TIGR01509 family)
MIKAIVSDLDGVIRFFSQSRESQIEARFNLPTGSIATAAFEKVLLDKVVTGQISDEEWRDQIRKKLKTKFPEVDCASAIYTWSDYPGEVNEEVLSYLKSLTSNEIPFCLLTNATDRLAVDLITLNILQNFRHVFNSSEIGFAKPSRQIYARVVSDLKLKPEEILFVDDSRSHVTAAQAFGLKAVQFTDLASLKKDIRQLSHSPKLAL